VVAKPFDIETFASAVREALDDARDLRSAS